MTINNVTLDVLSTIAFVLGVVSLILLSGFSLFALVFMFVGGEARDE